MTKDSTFNNIGTEPAKGMKDLLPAETAIRDVAISKIIETYRSFGFERIETPAVEDIRRLITGEGGENRNLVFKILKRGEKLDLSKPNISETELSDLGLRFDLTVPLVRYYCNNKNSLPKPFKSIQIGPVWRAERPQKGRYRQFYQCDIDIIGEAKVNAEIEVLTVAERTFSNLGFKSLKLRVNDRKILSGIANFCGFSEEKHSAVFILLDKLDKIGIDGVAKQFESGEFEINVAKKFVALLKKYLDSENKSVSIIKEICPDIPDQNINEVEQTINTVSKLFINPSSSIEFDLSLVRGMGYYTGQIFEAELPEFPGGSCGGGGRYDKLIGKMSGEETPACGFSIGFERILMILEENPKIILKDEVSKIACFYDPKVTDLLTVLKVIDNENLRSNGAIVTVQETPKKLTNRLDQLAEFGYNGFFVYSPEQKVEIKKLQKS